MILPGKHPVTEMIIRHDHNLNGHVGSYQVLDVLRKCHVCRRQNAKLGEQVTAPLPVVRVSSDSHRIIYPFAAVGLDYFGPRNVKNGPNTRSKRNVSPNKRYGCIFTCRTTDSFVNAILRFVGRRGPQPLSTVTMAGQERIEEPKWMLSGLCKRGIRRRLKPP